MFSCGSSLEVRGLAFLDETGKSTVHFAVCTVESSGWTGSESLSIGSILSNLDSLVEVDLSGVHRVLLLLLRNRRPGKYWQRMGGAILRHHRGAVHLEKLLTIAHPRSSTGECEGMNDEPHV